MMTSYDDATAPITIGMLVDPRDPSTDVTIRAALDVNLTVTVVSTGEPDGLWIIEFTGEDFQHDAFIAKTAFEPVENSDGSWTYWI